MATMTIQQRADCSADYQRAEPKGGTFSGVLKADVRAAIDAADQWASDNAAAFNSALPLPARTALTSSQKARLLAAVLLKRYTTGT